MNLKPNWYRNQDDSGGGIATMNDLTPTGVAPVSPQVIQQGFTQNQLDEFAEARVKAALYDQQLANQGGNDDDGIPDDAFESVESLKNFMASRETALVEKIRNEVRAELAPSIVSQHIGGIRDGLDAAGNAVIDKFLGGMDAASQAQVLSNPDVKNMMRNAARMADIDAKTPIPGANGVAPGMGGVARTADERDLIAKFSQNYNVSVAEAEKKLFGGK